MRLFVTLALIASTLPAQGFRYSPPDALTVSGGGNTYPFFFASQRYQQVHADVRGMAIVINELGFRRSPASTVYASAIARTIDAEVLMGNGDYATSTTTFASNYTSMPTQAIVRKMINLPDITNPTTASPEPFNILFPFDTPFVYTGTTDLTWDILIHGNTSTGAYFCDARGGYNTAGVQNVGTGCVATGQMNTMLQQATVRTLPAPQNLIDFAPRIFYGPQAAMCAILMATQTVNTPVPGLCSNLHVLNVVMTFPGMTATTNGVFTASFTVPFQQNYVGVPLAFQGVALDSGQSGIGVAVTNGAIATMVAQPTLPPARRIWGAVNALNGSTDMIGTTPNPYGLVTRFGHL